MFITKLEPGPASSIPKALAYASDPGFNTGGIAFAPWKIIVQPRFFINLTQKKQHWICKTANFNSLDWVKGSNVAQINWLQDLRWSHNLLR